MHNVSKWTLAVLAAAVLTVAASAAVLAVHQTNLPDAAGSGHATADDAVDVWVQLGDNQDSLLSTLGDVVDRLGENDADAAAVDAVNNVIDMLTNDDIGLNRAGDAVSGDHPNSEDHPGQP